MDDPRGVNDMLDRDGSRTPMQFHIPNDNGRHPLEAQIVQAATKWKRMALKRRRSKLSQQQTSCIS
jgi:aspartate--ammonia ligase